jgi:hypothetical protein
LAANGSRHAGERIPASEASRAFRQPARRLDQYGDAGSAQRSGAPGRGNPAGLIIAAPEYAHGVPGAFKNALDWLVASDAFPGKPVAMINTAPRSFHAQSALRETLATMSARLIPEAFVALPLTGKMVDAAEIAANPRFAAALRAALDAFVEAIRGDAA